MESQEDSIEKHESKPKGRPQRKETAIAKLRREINEDVKEKVVLVQEEKVPPPVMTLSQYKQLQEKKPEILPQKRPMSEAQKANIQRLIEANKARREAKNLSQPTIPEEIPEGYKAVYIQQSKEAKPKQVKIQQPPVQPQAQPQYPNELMEMMKRFNERLDQLSTKEKAVKERKPPASRKKKFTQETSESEVETEESGYDTSDTEYINKYEKKAQKRIEAVKQIETKLKQAVQPVRPKGRYDNMSLF